MRKLFYLTALMILAASVQMSAAQENTATTTTQTNQGGSNVNIFFVACETQGVLNFDGTMDPGYDIYYQIFSAAGGGGQALTALRRVTVSGSYAVSDQVSYNSGQTLSAGATGSVRVIIAREDNPQSTTYDTTVNDIQDGCASPSNPLVSGEDTDSATTGGATTGVRSPSGGFLEIINPRNPIVVIGVPQQPGRSNKPGEIFAECDQYREISDPGIVYDNDNIVIFWSWYARTIEQVEQHIANANYEIRFQRAPLLNVQVSPIQKLGTNYWVFYTAQIGNLAPGTYGVEFKLSWENVISDGYARFGPETSNERFNSTCTFTVQRNPLGDKAQVSYNPIYSLR